MRFVSINQSSLMFTVEMGQSTYVPPRNLQYSRNNCLIDWLRNKNDAYFTEFFWTLLTLGLKTKLVPKEQNTIFIKSKSRTLWIDRETEINCAEVHYFCNSVHYSIKRSIDEANVLSMNSKHVPSLGQGGFASVLYSIKQSIDEPTVLSMNSKFVPSLRQIRCAYRWTYLSKNKLNNKIRTWCFFCFVLKSFALLLTFSVWIKRKTH